MVYTPQSFILKYCLKQKKNSPALYFLRKIY